MYLAVGLLKAWLAIGSDAAPAAAARVVFKKDRRVTGDFGFGIVSPGERTA